MKNSELNRRVKELRIKLGSSQEELAERTGLSLRTIQRIENEESVPRGDTLKRLSFALNVTPDEIIELKIQEDNNVIRILNLSQLGFIVFPILGIIIPLSIWILKKDKTKYVDYVGKSILNFQMSWTLFLFIIYVLFAMNMIFHLGIFPKSIFILIIGILYSYNFGIIITNTLSFNKKKKVNYKPAINILH